MSLFIFNDSISFLKLPLNLYCVLYVLNAVENDQVMDKINVFYIQISSSTSDSDVSPAKRCEKSALFQFAEVSGKPKDPFHYFEFYKASTSRSIDCVCVL